MNIQRENICGVLSKLFNYTKYFSFKFSPKIGNFDNHDYDNIYALRCNDPDFHPPTIYFDKVDMVNSRNVREVQSNYNLFRNNLCPCPSQFHLNNNFPANRQPSHGDMSTDARAGNSTSEDTESCGRQTVWNKIRGFFQIFKRDKSQHQRNNPIGLLQFEDLKVHGLKNTKEVKISGFSENMLKVRVEFPNLMLTSKYEMSNWGKSSTHKINGHGRMEMTLKNVEVKFAMPIIEETVEGQKSLRAINPKIEMKMGK